MASVTPAACICRCALRCCESSPCSRTLFRWPLRHSLLFCDPRRLTACSVVTNQCNYSSGGGTAALACGQPTNVCRALQHVTVAHADSSPSRRPSLRPSRSGRSNPISSSASSAFAVLHVDGVAPPRGRGSLGSDGAVFAADDAGGPPATRASGAVPMRSLPLHHAEDFFFRSSGGHGEDAPIGSSGLSDDADEGNGTQASPLSGMTNSCGRRSTSAVSSSRFCRLCREEIEADHSPRTHILASSRMSHTNHTCREVSLDTLTLLSIRGFPIDDILMVWADRLYHHAIYPRIPSLVDPRWSLEKRIDELHNLLLTLKDLGVIDLSLAAVTPEASRDSASSHYHRRRVAFERLEYVGDNAWGSNISSRIMLLYPDQQWTYSQRAYSFNCFRDACDMNVTLDFMFDCLRLNELLGPSNAARVNSGKMKADLVEGLFGELLTYSWGMEPKLLDDAPYVEVNGLLEAPLCALIQHCLTELYDILVLQYSRELLGNALPLAKELGAKMIWKQVWPPLRRVKRSQRGGGSPFTSQTIISASGTSSIAMAPTVSLEEFLASSGNSSSNTAAPAPPSSGLMMRVSSTRTLPAQPRLFSTPVAVPAVVPHPLRHLPLEAIPRWTYCNDTEGDVFAGLRQSYERLGLLREESTQMQHRVAAPRWASLIADLVPQLCHGEADEGQTMQRLIAAMDEGSMYCRDAAYDVHKAPVAYHAGSNKSATCEKTSRTHPVESPLNWVLDHAFPLLLEDKAADGSTSGAGQQPKTTISFATSRYVPPDVRLPPAGVVTDRNQCHGVFAYLAYKVPNPLECVPLHPLPRVAVVSPASSTVKKVEQSSSTDNNPLTMASLVKHSEDGGAAPAADEMTGQVAPPLADENKEAEGEAQMKKYLQDVEAAVRHWRLQAKKKRIGDDELFGMLPAASPTS